MFKQGDWPAQDVVVDTSKLIHTSSIQQPNSFLASSQVQGWMKELDGYTIPPITPTDGTCAGSPASVANAAANGWWSCGGYTRDTDITACPDKMTWGVSFDDGPAPYSKSSHVDL